MRKLLAIALIGLNSIFGYSDDADNVNLNDLLYFQSAQYTLDAQTPFERTIPLLICGYGKKEVNEIAAYAYLQQGDMYITKLLETDIDTNNDGIVQDYERRKITDLRKLIFDDYIRGKKIKQKNNSS